MTMQKLLTSLAKRKEFESVLGDVIPGPPPEFVPNWILNIQVAEVMVKTDNKLAEFRRLAEETLRLISQSLPSDFFGSISVRLFTRSSGIRDYCANLSADALRQATWSGIFWNETSQDESISAQLGREGRRHGDIER